MTAITDATTVLETLIGRTLTGPQLSNIGLNFAKRNPFSIWQPTDPQNPTNEEYAQHILDCFIRFGRETAKNGAEFDASQTAQADIIAAGEAAVGDFT